jgi:hypothetical protein
MLRLNVLTARCDKCQITNRNKFELSMVFDPSEFEAPKLGCIRNLLCEWHKISNNIVARARGQLTNHPTSYTMYYWLQIWPSISSFFIYLIKKFEFNMAAIVNKKHIYCIWYVWYICTILIGCIIMRGHSNMR